MKELFPIVRKELSLIKSQRMTLALTILSTLLVIGALGLAFGSGMQMQR